MTSKEQIEKQEQKDREEVIKLFNTIFKDVKYTSLPISATTDITVTATTTGNCTGIYNVEIKERNVPIDRFNDFILQAEPLVYGALNSSICRRLNKRKDG